MARHIPMEKTFTCLLAAFLAAGIPTVVQAADNLASWKVEIESRAESTDSGKITYRLTAEQGLVEPPWQPVMTVSSETLTYAPQAGKKPKSTVIQYLNLAAGFGEPNLTCDSVAVRLLSPKGINGVATKPFLHFRPDFLGPGFLFQVKIPHGYHYVAGSAVSSRFSGLLPNQKPRPFLKTPQYSAVKDKANPHLLTILLPEPEAHAPGTGVDAPYGIEFTLAPD